MSQAIKINKKLCEKIKMKNIFKSCHEICAHDKEKPTKAKSRRKKCNSSTISMIEFYESIPNYEEISHLPDYDFSERLQLLKKIHCDLSNPLSQTECEKRTKPRCKRKKFGKKRKESTKSCVGSPSLCNSSSQLHFAELDELDSSKKSFTGTSNSQNTLSIPTPTCTPRPTRLHSIREKLLADIDEYGLKFDKKCSISKADNIPLCSPKFEFDKDDHVCRSHFHHPISHPCDLFFHRSNGLDSIFEHKSSSSSSIANAMQVASCGQAMDIDLNDKEIRDKPILGNSSKKKLRRAKSCPKELYSNSNYFSNGADRDDQQSGETQSIRRLCRDVITPNFSPHRKSQTCSRVQRSTAKAIPKIEVQKPKSKTPNSMDNFLSSKMVRSNLAANLRQEWSRKKVTEMTNRQLRPTVEISKFIPKCHRWNVRDTPAWKSFTLEDTTTEKLMREEARREEQKLRQHAHSMNMNIMRARVKSAQLLLEGRSLSAKS